MPPEAVRARTNEREDDAGRTSPQPDFASADCRRHGVATAREAWSPAPQVSCDSITGGRGSSSGGKIVAVVEGTIKDIPSSVNYKAWRKPALAASGRSVNRRAQAGWCFAPHKVYGYPAAHSSTKLLAASRSASCLTDHTADGTLEAKVMISSPTAPTTQIVYVGSLPRDGYVTRYSNW
jgi:hypothetical protein